MLTGILRRTRLTRSSNANSANSFCKAAATAAVHCGVRFWRHLCSLALFVFSAHEIDLCHMSMLNCVATLRPVLRVHSIRMPVLVKNMLLWSSQLRNV